MDDDEIEDEELDEDVDDLMDDDVDVDGVDDSDDVDGVDPEVDDAIVEGVAAAPPTRRGRAKGKRRDSDEDDIVDLDEEHHPDDVEASLDVLLKERTASGALDENEAELDDDDDEVELDDRAGGSTRIVPRRANEFLCQSCFLVLPLNQLADKKKKLCRDCA